MRHPGGMFIFKRPGERTQVRSCRAARSGRSSCRSRWRSPSTSWSGCSR